MENSRAAVWKCGGRQNKNSVAGDELHKTQHNEDIKKKKNGSYWGNGRRRFCWAL